MAIPTQSVSGITLIAASPMNLAAMRRFVRAVLLVVEGMHLDDGVVLCTRER